MGKNNAVSTDRETAALRMIVERPSQFSCVISDDDATPARTWTPGAVIALLFSLALVAWAYHAIWLNPGRWGREDWDYFAHHYEACRKSIFEYGEYPWWNPWNCGGMPLAPNPQIGLWSPTFLCTAIFGVWAGLKMSVFGYALLAAAGAFVLARQLTGCPLAGLVCAVIYACNGAATLYFSAGHFGIQNYAWLPWIFNALLTYRTNRHCGWVVGGCLSMATLQSLHYVTVFLYVMAFAIGVWLFARRRGFERRRLFECGLVALLVVLAFCGRRILLAAQQVIENPRPHFAIHRTEMSLAQLADFLTRWQRRFEAAPTSAYSIRQLGWHERGAYVGWPVLVLFLCSFRHGCKWWHVLAITGLAISLGNARWYHPGYWLHELPVFAAMRVVTRWRIAAMLGIAVGAAVGLSGLVHRRLEWLAMLVAIAIVSTLAISCHVVLTEAFVIAPSMLDRAPISGTIEQLARRDVPRSAWSSLYPAIVAGRGVIAGYEPLVAGYQINTAARGLGDDGYRGEFGPAPAVRMTHWSPNRIQLAGPPGVAAWINQNSGSYWTVNSERPFSRLHSVDRTRALEVAIPDSGRLDFRVDPPLRRTGLILNAIGWLGCGGILSRQWFWRRSSKRQIVR